MLITPENKKKLARFKEIKRGYYSLIVVLILIVFSLFAEFFINNKALIVSYQGEYYFPVLGKFYSGETFGLDYSYEADYKELKKISQEKADLNLALLKKTGRVLWQNKFRLGKDLKQLFRIAEEKWFTLANEDKMEAFQAHLPYNW